MRIGHFMAIVGVMLASSGVHAQSRDRFVVLMSIDGLRPVEFMSAEACSVELPVLSALRDSGVHARAVTGVLPTVTYPSHATLVTGTYPRTHGVLNNVRASDGAPWHFDRDDIGVPTLWDVAHEAGYSTAIVTWPSSYGADVDYLISENLAASNEMEALVRAGATPGLFEALTSATGPPVLAPFGQANSGVPLDRMTTEFSAEIVRRFRPNLLLVHFLDLDSRSHFEGVGAESACGALQRIDGLVGQLRAAYRDAGILAQTDFVVVSDHGFLAVHTVIDVFSLLAEAGGDDLRDRLSPGALDVRLAGGSAAAYLNGGDVASLTPRDLDAVRTGVERAYGDMVRWLDPGAAAAMGGFPGAAFVLCASPGYSFGAGAAGDAPPLSASTRLRGHHGYCPDEASMDATFLAAGPTIRAVGEIPRIRMIDVAPTVAALLGLVLDGADGEVVEGILEPAR